MHQLHFRAQEQRAGVASQPASRTGVLTLTPDGIIERADATAEHMFGYSADELTGARVAQLFPALSNKPLVEAGGARLASRLAYLCRCGGAFLGVRKDGTSFRASLCPSVVRPGRETRVRLIAHCVEEPSRRRAVS